MNVRKSSGAAQGPEFVQAWLDAATVQQQQTQASLDQVNAQIAVLSATVGRMTRLLNAYPAPKTLRGRLRYILFGRQP